MKLKTNLSKEQLERVSKNLLSLAKGKGNSFPAPSNEVESYLFDGANETFTTLVEGLQAAAVDAVKEYV